MGINHSTVKSFGYAFQGIKASLKKEPNLRIHVAIGIIALLLGFILKLSRLEWLLLAFIIFYVVTLELLNTVIESVVNLVSPEVKESARVAKDISAAVVLVSAILSIVVGLILFLPKIHPPKRGWRGNNYSRFFTHRFVKPSFFHPS